MRVPRKNKTELDLKVPVNVSEIPKKEGDCFGELWDMSSSECPQCADKDLCAILFRGKVDAKGIDIKKEMGLNHYLDEADFESVTDEKLNEFIVSGETHVLSLKEYVAKQSKCDDNMSVVNFLKLWIKSNPDVYTKDGIVWKR